MRFSRLGLAVLFCSSASAQKPVGITDFVGNWLDYYHAVSTTIEGDHDAFTAWASGTTLGNPNVCDSRVETCTFPDVNGLPIVGLINDGHVGNCSGNIELLQLSKLPTPFQTATSANTLLTPYPNCFSSYGGAPGDTAPYSGHLWYQAGGDGNTNGTWKGTVMAFRNSVLLAPFYRQNSPGDHYGDSSMMLSPDAGRTWIDYSRYNSYTVTSTSCAGTTATLAVTGASGLTGAVYVHDVGPVYNGKHTVASASSSQITYSVYSCAGASGSTGAFGPLDPYGSAPPYAAGAMMWSSGAANPMGLQAILNYGQDGNYPAGIEPACDPALYVCGIAYDAPSGNFNARLWRVPVGKEMVPTSYQWYTCPGYSSQWPAEDTACNGNLAGSWTGTLANSAVLFSSMYSALRPGICYSMQYLPSHQSYLLQCTDGFPTSGVYSTPYRFLWMWAPHPWGPFYEITTSECNTFDAQHLGYCDSFSFLMNYQENIISMNPPRTQIRTAVKGDFTSEGHPSFWAIEAAGGRVPVTGMARRADFKGLVGQNGMGHRFVSDNMAGAISRQGKGASGTYKLDWWVDLWDHGGIIGEKATNRPYFRDSMSGGSRSFNVAVPAGNMYAQGAALLANGVQLTVGCCGSTQLVSSFTDGTVSANSGNASWTFVAVFQITNPSCATSSSCTGNGVENRFNRPLPLLTMGVGGSNVGMQINVGRDTSGNGSGVGNVAVSWGQYPGAGGTNPTIISTPANVINLNTWYFLAVTAKANGSGSPTITMYVGNAGTITEYGGASLATAGTGTTLGGLTKTCLSGTNCTVTPAVSATGFVLGSDSFQESMNGTYGEAGLFSGVVPGHAIREIYRTLRADWVRVGRGAI
jgi:hypothetical protein